MDALYLLANRVSCGKLQAPAPTRDQRRLMYAAAFRAADHANLQPWRFLEIEGDGLLALGKLFVKAAVQSNPGMTEADIARLERKPQRAPLIIAAIARYSRHPKVPEWEQMVAAGCAVQNLINAAFAQDIGAYWRTGSIAENPLVTSGLGIAPNEKLIGFVYLGTRSLPVREPAPPDVNDFVATWPAN